MDDHPDALVRMSELLATWEADGDRRRIFLDCYRRMTRNMRTALADGRFGDAVWVDGLLQHFADYYFNALASFEASAEDVPAIWLHAHRAAGRSETTTFQNLLLGVNAHINFDLVFAVRDVLQPEWASLSPEMRDKRYRDHCRVNDIIGETVDEVQDQVVERFSPGWDVVDKLGGRIDEWAASWMIARWREEVWRRAIAILECDSVQDLTSLQREVESSAMERAHLLLLV